MMLRHGAISRCVLCFGAVCPARLGGLELRRRRARLALRLLVGEDGCRDPADAFRVGDGVDLDDLALGNGEPHHDERLPMHRDDHSSGSIYHCGMQLDPWTREARGQALECVPGNGCYTLDHHGGYGNVSACVDSHHDIGIEQVDESAEITLTRSQKEGVHYVALTSEIGVWNRYIGAPHAAPCSAGKLPRRHRGPTNHGGYLLEGQLEHIVEDERQSLSRRQGIEYHKERKTNRVGKQRLLLRLKLPIRADDRVGYVDPEGILAASVARTQHVEAHAGDDSRQPSPQILDLVRT